MKPQAKPWTVAVLVLTLAAGAFSLSEAATTTEDVVIESLGGRLNGYLVRPIAGGRRPGLVLVHAPEPLSEEARSRAGAFAAPGFTVLAVDLAEKGTVGAGQGTDAIFQKVKAAVDYLAGLEEVDPDRLAAVWWGFGAGWPDEIVPDMLRVEAVAVAMGGGPSIEELTRMRSEILDRYGAGDLTVTMDTGRNFQAVIGSGDDEAAIYLLSTGARPASGEAAVEAMLRLSRFLEENLGEIEVGKASQADRRGDTASRTPMLLYLLAGFAAGNRP